MKLSIFSKHITRFQQWSLLLVLAGTMTASVNAAPLPAPLLKDQAVFGTDRLTGHGFGHAVGLDGDIAVVGVEGGDPNASVHVFERSGTTWRRQGRLGDSRAFVFDGFGYSVAVSGQTIAVGDIEQNGFTGAAYAFVRQDGPGLNAWNITDNNGSATGASYIASLSAGQQASLATNAWRYSVRTRMVHDLEGTVSMYFSYGNNVRRWIFFLTFNANGDLLAQTEGTPQQQHVLTSNGNGADDYHLHEIEFDPATGLATYRFDGTSVRTWAGQTLAGAQGIRWGAGSSAGRGSMNVHSVHFEMTGTGTTLARYDAGTPDHPPASLNPLSQGWSALNAAGTQNTTQEPLVPDAGSLWKEEARIIATGIDSGDQFGYSIDLSGDTMVVGAPDRSGGGAAFVFFREGSSWKQQAMLTATPAFANGRLGFSVAIDGNTVVVGARGAASSAGRAYVFTRSGTNWSQQTSFTAPVADNIANNRFGQSVDISGERIIVAAPGAPFGGGVYTAERSGGSWSALTRLQPAGTVSGDGFGSVVSMHGETVVVGAESGLASHVFNLHGGAWHQSVRRVYPDECEDSLGGLAIDGETIAVGVLSCSGSNAGNLYLQAPDYSDAVNVASYANQLLYHPSGAANGAQAGNLAAFRYKHLLYAQSDGIVRARFESMPSLYGPNERQRALEAEAVVTRALSLDAGNAQLGNLLLDLHYDRTVAEMILAKDTLTAADRARFGSSVEGAIAPPAPASGFIIDNEIPLQRRLVSTNKVAMQGYFDLLKKELIVEQTSPPTTRWAVRVLGFSSEYDSNFWSAAKALGTPDTYPAYGDITNAWASITSDVQREFLELGYDQPEPINAVSIYETLGPGAVDKISVRNANTGLWHEAWSGTAAPAGETSRIFTVTFPMTPFPVDAIRIDINSPAVTGWNEIDAVSVSNPGSSTFVTDVGFGHRLFQTLVPGRGLAPATYTNAAGQDVVVTTNSLALTNGMLFTGYKDLVLLFDLLRDHGRNTTTLARLLASRRNAGDLDEAKTVVGNAQQFLFLHGGLLKNMFSDLPPAGDPSGLAQAIDGWAQTLYSLAELQQTLAIDANPLGFAPDFLMLAENFFGVETHFDSFDSFAERLSLDSSSSPLRRAATSLADARTGYGQFRGFEDQIAAQFDDSTTAYEFRLFEIVGAFPGDDVNYTDDPTANPGSELDQQYRSIEVARLRILKNKTDISNLNKEVQIEQQRAADVSGIIIRYGNNQAKLTEEIGDINAAQAGANQLTDYFNPANLVSGASISIALNFGVQTISELEKAKLEARKERLAALEQSEIVGAESAARVKTLLLRMNTLVLDSQEASLLLNQEIARMTALYREKGELEKRLAEASTELASRYFADPLHRITSQATMIEANLSFDEAQKWMFFMARSLEYKINSPFTNNFLGRTWNSHSVFKARNADELVDLYDAMIDYNDTASRNRQSETSWFSIREDHLGYRTGVDAQGQPLRYLDPDTGELVPAIEAFRRYLRRNIRQLAGNSAEIVLEFSTAKDLFATANENFFRGPSFNPDGTIPDPGAYLDKIDGLHLRLPGNHSLGHASVPGRLSYGGTSFIRNPRVGGFDPARPDRLRNELTAYSTRYWFRDQDLVWRFAEAFSSQVTLTLSTGPRQETTADQIVVFKERSVAATGWVLSLRIRSGGQQLLNIDEMTDVELLFRHSSISRLQQ
ncbi:MAG: hypothetical protein IPK15_14690 [Verrucomicrobia bacterium]|nr:hypothetical protein [Verrucomicrobiota bacterium]